MANDTITRAEQKLSHELDSLADSGTELIGSAAGAVADPKAGLAKARSTVRGTVTNPKTLLLVFVAVLVALLLWRRGRR